MNGCLAEPRARGRGAYLAIALSVLLVNELARAGTTAVTTAHAPAPNRSSPSARGNVESIRAGGAASFIARAHAAPQAPAAKAVPLLLPPRQQRKAAAAPLIPLVRPLAPANGALRPLAGNLPRASLPGTRAAVALGGAQHRAPVNASLGGPATFDARKLTRR